MMFPDVEPQPNQLIVIWAKPPGELQYEPYFATYRGMWFRTSGWTAHAFRIDAHCVAFWKEWLA